MARMAPLKIYRDRSQGFHDLLNWGSVIEDGVVLNKDGSLLAGWFYRGEDLATVPIAKRNHVSSVVSGALTRLGSEWMLHQDVIREEACGYPEPRESAFPDPISKLIDEERRLQFQAEGGHYESSYGLVVTFLPPLLLQNKLTRLFSSEEESESKSIGTRILREFQSALNEIEDRLSGTLRLERMRGHRVVDEFGFPHTQDRLLHT